MFECFRTFVDVKDVLIKAIEVVNIMAPLLLLACHKVKEWFQIVFLVGCPI
jgi:hypothetical protein